MNREGAKLILKTWVECPVCFGNQNCPKDEEEHCKAWCWRQNEVKEAVGVMLSDNKSKDWIPVSERLPEDKVNPITRDAYVYPVTVDLGGIVDIRYYSFCRGHWYNQGPKEMDDLVIAWMPLPEPYKAE